MGPHQARRQSDPRRGAFGIVYTGVLHGQPVAIKSEVLREGEEVEAWMKAARLHFIATCPHIVAMHGIIVDREDSGVPATYYIVMERLAGTMTDLLLTPGSAHYGADMELRLALLAEVASGLAYLHAASVIHADVKPDNVLLTAVTSRSPFPTAKLADFGSSVLRHAGAKTRETLLGKRGTLVYMDPGLLDGSASLKDASDVYSFGVMAWQVLTGLQLYEAELRTAAPATTAEAERLLKEHVCGPHGKRPPVAALVERGVPPSVVALVESCWAPSQASRPTMAEVHRALEEAAGVRAAGESGGGGVRRAVLACAPMPAPTGAAAPVTPGPLSPPAAAAGGGAAAAAAADEVTAPVAVGAFAALTTLGELVDAALREAGGGGGAGAGAGDRICPAGANTVRVRVVSAYQAGTECTVADASAGGMRLTMHGAGIVLRRGDVVDLEVQAVHLVESKVPRWQVVLAGLLPGAAPACSARVVLEVDSTRVAILPSPLPALRPISKCGLLLVHRTEAGPRVVLQSHRNSAWWMGTKWKSASEVATMFTDMSPHDLAAAMRAWTTDELIMPLGDELGNVWWHPRDRSRLRGFQATGTYRPVHEKLRTHAAAELARRGVAGGDARVDDLACLKWDTIKGDCDFAVELPAAIPRDSVAAVLLRCWAGAMLEAQQEAADIGPTLEAAAPASMSAIVIDGPRGKQVYFVLPAPVLRLAAVGPRSRVNTVIVPVDEAPPYLASVSRVHDDVPLSSALTSVVAVAESASNAQAVVCTCMHSEFQHLASLAVEGLPAVAPHFLGGLDLAAPVAGAAVPAPVEWSVVDHLPVVRLTEVRDAGAFVAALGAACATACP